MKGQKVTEPFSERCLEAYEISGYTRLATSEHLNWCDDDSVMEYASGGSYFGVDDITEYSKYDYAKPEFIIQ